MKSMRMLDSYSFRANSSTMVDLPIRRAPSMRRAVLPLLSCFHLSRRSYILRLNIRSGSILQRFVVTKIVVYLLSSKFFRPKSTKSSKFFQAFSAESSKSTVHFAPRERSRIHFPILDSPSRPRRAIRSQWATLRDFRSSSQIAKSGRDTAK